MRIEYDDDTSFEVEPGDDLGRTIRALASSDGFKNAVKELAGDAYYREFSHDQSGIPESYAEKIMQAFLGADTEQGSRLDAAEDWITEDAFEHCSYSVTNAYNDQVMCLESHSNFRDALIVALARQHDDADTDEIASQVDDLLREACCELIAENDDSSPLDAIHSWAKVELCYIPDYAEMQYIDDMWIWHHGVCSSSVDVIPNENFARFLRFANVSSADYLAYMRDEYGRDLTAEPKRDDFNDDYSFRQAAEKTQQWRDLSVEADPSKPQLMSLKTAVAVLDNATYGGVPVLACTVPLRAFMERDWSKPMKVTGGQVGIHDFINGSGHLEDADGDLIVPAEPRNWVVSNKKGYGIDSVYGFVPEALRVEFEDVEPTPAVAAVPGV